MIILQLSDFEDGIFKVPTNQITTELQFYIDKVERDYLPMLLGVELNNLFLADLTSGVPTSARFLDIFNSFNVETDNFMISSDGMKQMLKGFVYYLYVRELNVKVNSEGIISSSSENSVLKSAESLNLSVKYNNSVDISTAIQTYIFENLTIYPEFRYYRIQKTSIV